jgi:putative oxidoreductase
MSFLLRLYTDFIGGRPGVGLLIFRIVTGLALMQHGWMKVQHPFSWMGPTGAPPIMQGLATLGEFGGGLAILLGLLTPIGCLGVICTMIGALVLVHLPMHQPWVGKGMTMEAPLGYLAAAVMLFLTGPGRYSLDGKLFGRRMLSRTETVERKERINV